MLLRGVAGWSMATIVLFDVTGSGSLYMQAPCPIIAITTFVALREHHQYFSVAFWEKCPPYCVIMDIAPPVASIVIPVSKPRIDDKRKAI